MQKYYKVIIFILLLWFAVVVSNRIVIPFSNEFEVSGILDTAKFNPLNNILRYVFIVFFPFLAYSVIILFERLLEKFGFIKKEIVNAESISLNNNLCDDNSIRKEDKRMLLAVFGLFLFVYLGCNTYKNPPLDTFHEGETLGMATDYQSEKKPYRDTIFLRGVFQDPLRSVVAFKLFGRSIESQRLVVSILDILVFVLFFVMIFFLFDLKIIYGVFSGTILFFLLNVYYSIPYRDITTYLFIIAVSLFYKNFIRNPQEESLSKKRLFTFCFLVFSSFFIPIASFANSIDRGFYASFAALFFLIISVILLFRKKSALTPFIISSVAGCLAGLLVIFAAVKGALYSFLKFTFVIMPSYKDFLDGYIYNFESKNLVPVAILSSIVFWIGNRFLLYIFNDENKRFIDRLQNFIAAHFMELFLFSLSFAFFRSALGRSDSGHIAYVSAPLYITIVYIILKNYIGLNKINSKIFYYATFTVLFVVIFNTYSKYEDFRNADWWRFSTGTKDDQLVPENYKSTVKFLKDNLSEDEYFVTLTTEGIWYYLVNKPCPIKFPIIWFASPKFYQEEVVRQMKEKGDNVKYIIYKNNHWGNSADFIPNKERLPILFKYIEQNYQFSKIIDDQEIWEIKNNFLLR